MDDRAKAFVVTALLVMGLLAVYPAETKAQTQATELPLTFHAYSTILTEPNGSLIAYEGVDGAPPTKATADQFTVDAKITGSYYGFTIYNGMVVWATQLPCDIHVKGTVTIKAYISSTHKPSMFSGASYGMGLADFDENNQNVKEFIVEGPHTVGSSPFGSTPAAYSLSLDVDYTFKQGHAIGFFVGVGSNDKDFTATIYFDAPDRASGAILPIIETANSQAVSSDAGNVAVTANSAIQELQYDQTSRTISFKAAGIDYTQGTATVDIPKTAAISPFTCTQGTQTITPTTTENATYYQIAFTHTRNDDTIKVVGSAVPTPTPAPTDSPSPTSSSSGSSGSSRSSEPSSTGSTSFSPSASPQVSEASLAAVLFLVVFVSLAVFVWVKKRSK